MDVVLLAPDSPITPITISFPFRIACFVLYYMYGITVTFAVRDVAASGAVFFVSVV